MTDTTHAVLLGVFTLSSCVWVGGYAAIAIVARVAVRTLDPAQRVAFFRGLGRSYLRVGTPALVVALGTGAELASGHAWDGVLIATVIVAAVLVVSLALGVAQARQMTRLRAAALAAPSGSALTARVHRGARAATALRAAIGLLSLTLIALGSLLAT
ncbi:MAG: hypothetical protein ACRDQ1_19835 [Sciscionella sp.]